MLFLDMVNKVLSAIDSQSVSSIDDSDESEQVASIIQRCYYEIIYSRNWSFLQREGHLIPTYEKPNQMRVPEDCLSLIRVKYNRKPIKYISPNDFRDLIDSREPNTVTTNEEGILTNADPLFYTSFDDEILTFDAFNIEDNSFLMEFKSYCLYSKMPKEINSNDDTFELPTRFEPVLLNYAIAIAMDELKSDTQASQRYEQRYKVGFANMLQWSKTLYENEHRYDTSINFGMRSL